MAVNKNIVAPANGTTTNNKAENGPILILTPCHNSHEFIERRIVVPKNEENAIKIGRAVGRVLAAPNNAIFDCKVLSRNHAVVWLEDDSFYIKDTKSSNGTFINNSRLSNSGEESAPTPLASGDILQLGVEIIDNAKKVASGCIIAMVRFINSQGAEIATRRSTANSTSTDSMITERVPKHCLVVPEEQMYQMQQYIYEAKHREAALGQKLAILQEALKEAHEASETNWQAMINEERLLSRIEILESQLALISNKHLTNDDLRKKIEEFYTEKEKTEIYTKDCLRKANEEASEARLRLQEVELALLNVEEQNNFIRDQFQETERELEVQKFEYEKLHSNYDVVCQELEIARAANQHLMLIKKSEQDALAQVKEENDKEQINGDVDSKSDLITVIDDVIPPAPEPPAKEFADASVQSDTIETNLLRSDSDKNEVPSFEKLLCGQLNDSIVEANKENLNHLRAVISTSTSTGSNNHVLEEAITETIVSIAKSAQKDTEHKLLTHDHIPSTLANHNESESSTNNFLKSHKLSSGGNLALERVETTEDMISVFPIFSIFVLFLYNIMQMSSSLFCKKAVTGNAEITNKTGEDESKSEKDK